MTVEEYGSMESVDIGRGEDGEFLVKKSDGVWYVEIEGATNATQFVQYEGKATPTTWGNY